MRMSNTEAIMWAVEKDPALRSDFCNLTFLERPPDEDRIQPTLERALVAIPRLGQRVVGAPLRIVPPEFADDPTLDLDAHVRVVRVPAPRRRPRPPRPVRRARRATARPGPSAVGVHAHRGLGRRPGRAAAEGPPHDHRRRRRAEAVARARRLRARPDRPTRRPRDTRRARPRDLGTGHSPAGDHADAVVDAAHRNAALARQVLGRDGRHVVTHPQQLPCRAADRRGSPRRSSGRCSSPIPPAPT